MSATSTIHLSRLTPIQLLRWFMILATIYVIVMRVHMADTIPLWLDETWSGMIATRPDWSAFWREAWLDCNPPLYYLFLAGWVSLVGDSNLMLRLPSILFVIAAALLPLIWRPRGLNRTGVWTFAALILLWPPNLAVMVDARGYGLMLLLATGSCLVVVQMLEELTLRRAALWVGIGTMMFLTHYYAAVLITAQGLVLLYRHRLRLLTMWPTLPLAIPGLIWFAYHLPRLKDYARPDVAWYDATTIHQALLHLTYVVGAQNYIALAAALTTVTVAIVYRRRRKSGGVMPPTFGDKKLILTAITAAIGFAIAIVISLFQPSLTDRYLVPLVPTTMLGLTLLIQRWPRPDLAALLVPFAFLVPGLNPDLMKSELFDRAIYGYEQSSDFIRPYKPDRLIFLWDSPSAKIMDRHSLDAIGGYFLKRSGTDLPIQSTLVPQTADPNQILRATTTTGRPAIIWLYNINYRSAAKDHPPVLQNDPAWVCNRGTRSISVGSIACVKLVPRRS